MATELTDLDLGEWSICIDPANEDSTIEIVKSKSGLGPILKETDMSDHVETNDGAGDADFQAFAEANGDAILDEFNALSDEEKADALVGLAYENDVLEDIAEEQAESLEGVTKAAEAVASELKALRPKYDELKKSAAGALAIIEKMKAGGAKVEDDDTLSRITKSLADRVGGEANIPDDVRATLTDLVKAKDAGERKEAIQKAKTYGFGNAEQVADLETGIRKALGAEKADQFVALVKQAGGLAKSSGVFKAIGEDAGNADAASPIAKAKAGAEDIRKANPKLTPQQAQAQYWDENPSEYAAYRAEQRGAAA